MSSTTDRIEREIEIRAPVERVWNLLTEAEHLGRWFGDAGAEIDLRPGGALVLRWADTGATHGRVEHVEPPSRFAFRWVPYGVKGGPELVESNSTLVEFTLTASGDGTRLRVIESGFDALDITDDARVKLFAGNTGGWERETDELRRYAERE